MPPNAKAQWVAKMLPHDPKRRKRFPLATGLIDYFPDALDLVAEVSYVGNAQHNPGEPLHDARDKSTDDADALMRHFQQRGSLDSDGVRHSAKVAWRALRILQKEEEAHGAPLARGAMWPTPGYDPDSAAFRRFWQGCGMPKPGRDVPSSGTAHPMAAEGLRDQDETTPGWAQWWLP